MELYQLIVVDGDGYAEPETEPPPTHRREAYAVRATSTPVIIHVTTPIEKLVLAQYFSAAALLWGY